MLVALIVITGAIFLNRAWLVDWVRGIGYAPTAEMAMIRDNIALTEQGQFLFKAERPTLLAAEEFNQVCRDGGGEVAVLGCLTGGQIYLYDITAAELDGIREVTAAHELLHGVWARLDENEWAALEGPLQAVLAENAGRLGEELATYDTSVQTEELYVRAGTEIRNLPAELEQHFGQFFAERGKIVGYYEGYIAVFEATRNRAAELEQEINELKTEVEARTQTLETAAKDLQGAVVEFNACAEQVNCFNSQTEFTAERNNLLARQQALMRENEAINALVDDYNQKIEEYNQNALQSQKLEAMVNSVAPVVDF